MGIWKLAQVQLKPRISKYQLDIWITYVFTLRIYPKLHLYVYFGLSSMNLHVYTGMKENWTSSMTQNTPFSGQQWP